MPSIKSVFSFLLNSITSITSYIISGNGQDVVGRVWTHSAGLNFSFIAEHTGLAELDGGQQHKLGILLNQRYKTDESQQRAGSHRWQHDKGRGKN